MLRELISLPFTAARTAIELPRNMQRSVREANELMEVSREQLEVMRRQADQALEQAERMNELLGRVVKLTEPLERAQRGGEFIGEQLKRALFGAEELPGGPTTEPEGPPVLPGATEEPARKVLDAPEEAQGPVNEAGMATHEAEGAVDEAEEAADEGRDARGGSAEEPPVSPSER